MEVQEQDNVITLTKTFKAPKELVFLMFKNPHIQQWWGPTTYPVKVSNQDFTVGGSWHYCMVGPEGQEAWGKAFYDEIDEPNKLVFRDYFSNAEGAIDESLPSGQSTVTFDEANGHTTLTLRGEYQSSEEVKKLIEMGMVEGFKDTLTQLEALLEKAQ